MKRIFALMSILVVIGLLVCSKSKEVRISLTNPQNLAVAFDGYYILNQEPQEAMTGTTPKDYEISMKKGDQLIGIVYKSDSSNLTDTLRFRIYIDEVEQSSMSKDIILPTLMNGIGFQISVQ